MDVNSFRNAVALSGLIVLVMIAYAVILINTLVRIWQDGSKDPQKRMLWFACVLLFSPIALPAYYYAALKAKKQGSADRQNKAMADTKSSSFGADKERELARLLEMKKNGVINGEEFNRARKRLEM